MSISVPTCLVIEDYELDRRLMERVLTRQNRRVNVLYARTLFEARGILRAEQVSLIFLDNALPDGNGSDYLTELSKIRAGRTVPIIIVSDWPTPFMFAKAKAQNVLEVWSKSDFTVDRVQNAVGQLQRSA